MGIKAVWLMPIFTSHQHDDGYDVTDYKAINPDYRIIDDLKNLVVKAHSLGMKVILCLPTNHCSKDNPLFCSKDSGIRKDSWFIWSETDKGWSKPWEENDGNHHLGKTWFKDSTGLN